MRLFKFLAFLSAVSVVIVSMAWTVVEGFKDEATSSIHITQEGSALKIDTVEIKYLQDFLGEFGKKILIKVRSEHKSSTNTEGRKSQTTIEARSEKDFFANPIWTVNDEGNEVIYLNEELIASQTFGCCGDFDRSKIYHVDTGKSPATFIDDDFFSISVPNSGLGYRYFIQLDDKEAPADKSGHKYIGSVAYLDGQGKKSHVRLFAKVTPGWNTALSELSLVNLAGKKSKNVLRRKELELWDQDGVKVAAEAFKNFALTGKIEFDNKTLKFDIIVSGDKVDPAGIKTSPGLIFEMAP